MIAWKILVEKCGVLWSMWDDGGHAIVYAGNGFKNVPPPGWGKLAAFREEDDAIDHAKMLHRPRDDRVRSGRVLYKCDVEPSKDNAGVVFRMQSPFGMDILWAPMGTIACDSITLIERVPCVEVESS